MEDLCRQVLLIWRIEKRKELLSMDKTELLKFREAVEKERDRILSFWLDNTIDEENGGFVGEMTNELKAIEKAPKGLILNTRILWTYSLAYRRLFKSEYLKMINRAYDYLMEYFFDREYGGMYWMLDYQGNPLDSKKQIYGQAFAIYALSEFYQATGEEKALKTAVDIFRLIEKYSYDQQNRGYLEACNQDWSLKEDMRLSTRDMNEKKSMNTHLHILEAYTNLYRIWNNDELERKLKELIEVTIEHIIDNDSFHFILFFDEYWNPKSELISYGHDIEGSWLLYEAAELLGDQELLERVKDISIRMAEAVYNEGLAEDGSIYYEREGERLDTDRHWWPQAENLVGFVNAYQLTGEDKYMVAAMAGWQYIERYFIDREYGEWFAVLNENGEPYPDKSKVESWKSPYHNGRACFELVSRLEEILKGEGLHGTQQR
jgi:mannobiose 2-epimerase